MAAQGAIASLPVQAKTPRPLLGCNVYELVLRKDITDSDAAATVRLLGKRGISLIRFPAGAQWAGDWAAFEAKPDIRWRRLDAIVEAAESVRVALIPCMFWSSTALPFHCGESLQAWADPHSKTCLFAERYVEHFIHRYDRSPAMLMYEFLNEPNAWIDLPNALDFWPKHDPTIPPRLNTPADHVTSSNLRKAAQIFAASVRATSNKPISAGTDLPRSNASHLAHRQWDHDTLSENLEHLSAITPRNMNVLSIHVYREKLSGAPRTFGTETTLLSAFSRTARLDGRRSLVGEFGVKRSSNPDADRRSFRLLLDSIIHSHIDYAALWNYSSRPFQPEWDVSFESDRAYQLEMVAAENQAG